MKRVLKITTNTWQNASRDQRELDVVKRIGADVIVMAKGEKTGIIEEVNGFIVHRVSTRPIKNNKYMVKLNRLISAFTWAHYTKSLKADVISGHDLLALMIAYMSTLFMRKKNKPKLIYDSHEFEIGRVSERSKLQTFFVTQIEQYLMNKCAFSIMVNDSIADEVSRIHKLKERPVVVRNIPKYWKLDDEIIAQKRKQFCAQLNVPEDTFLVMYHGGIIPNRGIENMLKAVAMSESTAVIILGNGEKWYIDKLYGLCSELNIKIRTIFHPAVDSLELPIFIAAVNVGMVIVPAACSSYYYMLPNKYFENIQALTPIICSDFPEVERLTKRYEIGLTVDPNDVLEIKNGINKLKDDKQLYAMCKENIKRAKKELCWENESEVLFSAYSKVL
jgi:glycosyltransferase involved in cell wall biosynthesis